MLLRMSSPIPALRLRDWLMLTALSMLWGGSFFFNRVAVEELIPPVVVASRQTIGGLILFGVLRARGLRLPRGRRVWAQFLLMGLLNNAIPFSLIVWSQARIASGLASILNAATPLFTMLVAHLFTRDDRMTGPRILGLLAGFVGVVVVIGPAALGSSNSGGSDPVLPQLAILAAGVSYAVAGVFGRRFARQGLRPETIATGQVLCSAALLVPPALVGYLLVPAVSTGATVMVMPSVAVLVALFCLGALSTAAAYILYFSLLERVGATNLLMVTFLIPLTAILLGVVVLGEPLVFRQILGMLIVFAGILVAQIWNSLFGRR